MQWQKWIPSTKVTAGAFAAAVAFVILIVWETFIHKLDTAQVFLLGSALTVIIAYLMPERKKKPGSGDDDGG